MYLKFVFPMQFQYNVLHIENSDASKFLKGIFEWNMTLGSAVYRTYIWEKNEFISFKILNKRKFTERKLLFST